LFLGERAALVANILGICGGQFRWHSHWDWNAPAAQDHGLRDYRDASAAQDASMAWTCPGSISIDVGLIAHDSPADSPAS
jgi:hypothetical protein